MAMEQKESKSNLIADYYSQHYDELMTYVSSHLQHADESEDIVQNIFVRLLQMDKMITPVTLPRLHDSQKSDTRLLATLLLFGRA